jgi:hypothetical protein
MVKAHLQSGFADLRILGTTYEVFANAPDTFDVFGVDDFLHARYAMAHDVSFEEACEAVTNSILESILKESRKGNL